MPKRKWIWLAGLLPLSGWAGAEGVFELGRVSITGQRPQVGEVASEQVASEVTQGEIRRFDRVTVGDAVNLLSGVTVGTNSRNEQTVYLRGYDPRQVPLFIDGIPVYVPYDGYVDFGRFGTADLAAIQVAKGFSSVAYGPNTLGGAINLVSRKPMGVFEGDAHVGFGQENFRQASANVGTNQGPWYAQVGLSHRKADGFRLSGDFTPTSTEDGGRRNNSQFQDDKVSLKFGLTPGGGDEYALTYLKQNGEKGQPPSTDPASARYWRWPYWDKESLYFVSRTAIGGHETLKLRLFHYRFDNEVDTYTDATYRVLKTTGPGSVSTGRSIYHDRTVGGTVEVESRRLEGHLLRFVAQTRNDRHEELDGNAAVGGDFEDTIQTFAVEDAIRLNERSMVLAGLSRHALRPDKVVKPGSAYTLPGKQTANDVQLGFFHDFSVDGRIYITMAEKTRLPTLKDRYSQRLGSYVENPALHPEKARNYEVGYQVRLGGGVKADAAVFWNDVKDKIQSVNLKGAASCSATNKCQVQNVGRARIKGIELGIEAPVGREWVVGGNATVLDLKNLSEPNVKLTGVAQSKLIAHAQWRPSAAWEVVALLEHDGGRWASNTVKLPGFTTVNAKVAWRPIKELSAEIGVNNLADKNYELDYGFPAAGRVWFFNLRYRF